MSLNIMDTDDLSQSQSQIPPSGVVDASKLTPIIQPTDQLSLVCNVPNNNTTNQLLQKVLSEIQVIKYDNHQLTSKIESLSNEQREIGSKIDKFTNAARDTFHRLDCENQRLKRKLEFLENENELLYRQVNFQNLILVGLEDSQMETDNELKRTVSDLINQITKTSANIDTVYRIGHFKQGSNRATRIRFLSHSDRSKAFENRPRLPKHHYLNEDLPFRVRLDLGALRNKRSELFDSKITHSIDWKNKTISCDNGDTFTVKDGRIQLQQTTKSFHNPSPEQDEISEYSSEESTEEPPRKKGKASDKKSKTAFLEQRNQRSPSMTTSGPSSSTKNSTGGRGASKPGRHPLRRSFRNLQ